VEYRALYRRYRPANFSEVVGQQHVTETLAREVSEGKVAHAYLFAGPRGTGKTTTARILAKALNCLNRQPDGTPCNDCVSCTAIDEGSSLDVIELDAASHNSVDDIRDIRVSVSTVAVGEGARRVFILDEAHMLSKAAGNALLKTLEEPPSHVHFVLATTEPYKLLDTIRSRAQRFDFHAIGSETLTKHLDSVAGLEGYRVDAAAASLIARQARGSARDALSLLEQVAALGGGVVDVRGVRRAIGLAEADAPMRLVSAMVEQDAKAALELVAEMVSEGVDLRRFVSETIAFFRGIFLAHYAPNLAEVADEPGEVLEEWRAASKLVAAPDVLRVIDQLGDALIKLREGREERLMIELALLRLVRPEVVGDPASLAARLDRLEQRVKHLADAPAAARKPAVAEQEPPVMQDAPRPAPSAVSSPVESEPAPPPLRPLVDGLTIEKLEEVWPALLASVREDLTQRRWAFFREAFPAAVEDATVILQLPAGHEFHLAELRGDPRVADVVGARAADLVGGAVRVEFRLADAVMTADEDESVPDKDSLAEAPEHDPERLVAEFLGGELVSETPVEEP
jgi:DNA polymerase III subunit gamma/tau